MATQLRDYQQKAIEEIRSFYSTDAGVYESDTLTYENRRRVILQMATGSGKTATFAEMLKRCHEKGTPAIMVVRGAKLVHQASQRLTREGVPHGIYQAGNTRDTHHAIHVCSIDTLYARKAAPQAGFIVIDEVHLTGGKSYQWLANHENYKQSFFLGVTATPFSKTGLRHVGSDIIYPVTIRELMSKGYLVGARYRVPHIPNLAGVKKTGGEYNLKDLEARLGEKKEKSKLHGSLTSEWLRKCKGKKTILFGVSVKHAKELGEELEKVGARCSHIDGNTAHDERDQIIARLENNEIDVITSVGVLTTGVDIPSLECLLVCRPTQSYNLWIQMLGRGTRPYLGKDHFLVIDMAGNTEKHGPIEAEMVGDVEPTAGNTERSTMTHCKKCYAAFDRSKRLSYKGCKFFWCPACYTKMDEGQRDAKGGLIDIEEKTELVERAVEPWELDYAELVALAKSRGYKKGYVIKVIEARYGKEAGQKAYYRIRGVRNWPKKKAARAHTRSSSTKSSLGWDRSRSAEYGKMQRDQLKSEDRS